MGHLGRRMTTLRFIFFAIALTYAFASCHSTEKRMTSAMMRERAYNAMKAQYNTESFYHTTMAIPRIDGETHVLRIIFYMYRVDPLPTGVVRYRIYSPRYKITINAVSGAADMTELKETILDDEPDVVLRTSTGEIIKGEEYLLDGLQTGDADALERYRWIFNAWSGENPAIYRFIVLDNPEFADWLQMK